MNKLELAVFDKRTIIKFFFFVVLISSAFVEFDPHTTLTVSREYGIYFPYNAIIFLVGGGVITIFGFKLWHNLPKVLWFSGPVFGIYALLQVMIRSLLGADYEIGDLFYMTIELVNMSLSITMSYFYVRSLEREDSVALKPLCYVIFLILVCCFIAIHASPIVLPFVKGLTGVEITIDTFQEAVDDCLGFRRLYGPLGNSTSLSLVLLPITGYILSLLHQRLKMEYFFGLLAAGFFVFSTGSRVAVFGYVMLLAYFFLNRFKMRAVIVFVISVLALLFLYKNSGFSLPKKLNPFSKSTYLDNRRLSALCTCVNAWLSTRLTFFWGVGYTDIVLITKKKFLSSAGLMKHGDIVTKYGWLPGGAHSILGWTISGSGIIGFLFRCSFIYYFVFQCFSKAWVIFKRKDSVFLVSVLLSMGNLFTDSSHVASPMLMSCWFVFYIFALELLSKEEIIGERRPETTV